MSALNYATSGSGNVIRITTEIIPKADYDKNKSNKKTGQHQCVHERLNKLLDNATDSGKSHGKCKDKDHDNGDGKNKHHRQRCMEFLSVLLLKTIMGMGSDSNSVSLQVR